MFRKEALFNLFSSGRVFNPYKQKKCNFFFQVQVEAELCVLSHINCLPKMCLKDLAILEAALFISLASSPECPSFGHPHLLSCSLWLCVVLNRTQFHFSFYPWAIFHGQFGCNWIGPYVKGKRNMKENPKHNKYLDF